MKFAMEAADRAKQELGDGDADDVAAIETEALCCGGPLVALLPSAGGCHARVSERYRERERERERER